MLCYVQGLVHLLMLYMLVINLLCGSPVTAFFPGYISVYSDFLQLCLFFKFYSYFILVFF